MRKWTVDLTERELRTVLAAMDYARENGPRWWQDTRYVVRLYERLRGHGLSGQA